MKIGIPKALYYYYFIDKWRYFFKQLNVELISVDTTKDIIDKGSSYASSEMCLSLKIFLGHIDYLKDKCDYILIPNINNFGVKDQMCSNFSCLYDLVNNLFDINILTYEINYLENKKERKGLIKIGKSLGFENKELKRAYKIACIKYNKERKKMINENIGKLNLKNKKVLIISHPYNLYDNYIGKEIIKKLEKNDLTIVQSDLFDKESLHIYLSPNLYWKYSKVNLGAISYCRDKIDGIIFISTFPCGVDSLVNELVMRKINLPYLNLIIDDLDAMAGIETRIESFVDILEQN